MNAISFLEAPIRTTHQNQLELVILKESRTPVSPHKRAPVSAARSDTTQIPIVAKSIIVPNAAIEEVCIGAKRDESGFFRKPRKKGLIIRELSRCMANKPIERLAGALQ